MRKIIVSFVTPLLVAACSGKSPVASRPEPASSSRGNSESVRELGIPNGHLPSPGECRIWIPGTPPGRQARPRTCANILADAPAGSWIVYRPARSRDMIRVQVIQADRPSVIRVVRVYDAGSKRLLREEAPGDDDDHGDDRGRGRGRRRG